ncbi:MAG TPA: aminopeptidase P family protein [Novosphingobium sp.]|nr:aminopeptidase P family protein [Novosphingobium sp.]
MTTHAPATSASQRLSALRAQLVADGLDGFVIPISDEHMSEYVGAYAQRLEWLTGFGGSAGTAVVLAAPEAEPGAAIFVDGRYTLQVRDQVDGALYEYHNVPATSPARWLGEQAPAGARIGYDAWLHSRPWAQAAAAALAARGGQLVAVARNPVDAVWAERPAPSPAPAIVHPIAQAGQASQAKRAAVADWLREAGADATVITALDSVAWLLNIRGADVACTPVALSFVIARADGTADWFIAPGKVTPEVAAHVGNAVRIRDMAEFAPTLAAMGGQVVALDPERAVAAVFAAIEGAGARVIEARDPCVLPKAIKNPAEVAGHRAAQARDGAAVARFLHWLSVEGPDGEVDEIGAADTLHQFRREGGDLRDLSFETISGAGPNGAIVHYRVSEATNRRLDPGSVYLVDSGGQYPDGTTDITRTVWIGGGEPEAELRDRFTRVLKGHIALARAVFPRGTAGSQLDTLARQYLWAAGVDYAHGTGHGVGSFLSVHEGPQRIAKSAGGQAGTGQELLPGMILSNEPGYYKTGAWGIRIENLVLVESRAIAGAEGDYMGFETLTHVPIGRALVEPALLLAEERDWWNAYHAQVLAILAPQLEGAALDWLQAECAPL